MQKRKVVRRTLDKKLKVLTAYAQERKGGACEPLPRCYARSLAIPPSSVTDTPLLKHRLCIGKEEEEVDKQDNGGNEDDKNTSSSSSSSHNEKASRKYKRHATESRMKRIVDEDDNSSSLSSYRSPTSPPPPPPALLLLSSFSPSTSPSLLYRRRILAFDMGITVTMGLLTVAFDCQSALRLALSTWKQKLALQKGGRLKLTSPSHDNHHNHHHHDINDAYPIELLLEHVQNLQCGENKDTVENVVMKMCLLMERFFDPERGAMPVVDMILIEYQPLLLNPRTAGMAFALQSFFVCHARHWWRYHPRFHSTSSSSSSSSFCSSYSSTPPPIYLVPATQKLAYCTRLSSTLLPEDLNLSSSHDINKKYSTAGLRLILEHLRHPAQLWFHSQVKQDDIADAVLLGVAHVFQCLWQQTENELETQQGQTMPPPTLGYKEEEDEKEGKKDVKNKKKKKRNTKVEEEEEEEEEEETKRTRSRISSSTFVSSSSSISSSSCSSPSSSYSSSYSSSSLSTSSLTPTQMKRLRKEASRQGSQQRKKHLRPHRGDLFHELD